MRLDWRHRRSALTGMLTLCALPPPPRALCPPGEACALAVIGTFVVCPLRARFGGKLAGQVGGELAQPTTVCAQPVRVRHHTLGMADQPRPNDI